MSWLCQRLFHNIYASCVSKFSSLLLSVTSFTQKPGSIQERPFLNPFWFLRKKFSLSCFNFSFIIVLKIFHQVFTNCILQFLGLYLLIQIILFFHSTDVWPVLIMLD